VECTLFTTVADILSLVAPTAIQGAAVVDICSSDSLKTVVVARDKAIDKVALRLIFTPRQFSEI
jgi:hypothetical protein